MFCKYCGNELSADARFCASCGASVEEPTSREEITDSAFDDVMPDLHKEERASSERRILTLGICSVAFVCTLFFSLVGWILAVVGRKQIREHESRFGSLGTMAKIGRGLSLGGLIGGIVMTVMVTIWLIAYVALIVSIVDGSYYTDYQPDFAGVFAYFNSVI